MAQSHATAQSNAGAVGVLLRSFAVYVATSYWCGLAAAAPTNPAPTAALSPEEPSGLTLSDAQIAELETLSEQGQRACESRQYDACYHAFRRAQQLLPWPPHEFYIAEALVGMGRLCEGSDLWRSLLKREAEQGASATAPTVTDALKLARQRLAEVEPTIPSIEFVISKADQDRIAIVVDGRPLTRSELRSGVSVDPGRHQFRISQPGRVTQEREVTLDLGQRQQVLVALLPEQIELSAPILPAEPPNQWQAPVGWTLVSVGGAAAVAGVIVYAHKQDLNQQLEQDCGGTESACTLTPAEYEGRRGKIETYTDVSNGLIFGGTALLTAGAALLLWNAWTSSEGSSRPPEPQALQLTAGAHAKAGWLQLSGRF